MLKESYIEFINEANLEGSGKANSYIKALEYLEDMLRIKAFGFSDCINIFSVTSIDRLDELYSLVHSEKNKEESMWLSTGVPKSYLKKGYCNAAIRSYQLFLSTRSIENIFFNEFRIHKGDVDSLIKKLDINTAVSLKYIDKISDKKGKDILKNVKSRVGQHLFRRMVLDIYSNTCCISGLNVPKLNIASHIVPWAENEDSRLDPSNGLCLSATYDAAFDKKLISLDEDYRLLISKEIREYYSNESVKQYFQNKEGEKIKMPVKYIPNQCYLEMHRSEGSF